MRGLGVALSPDQLMALRDDMDADFDGKISLSEFKAAVELRKPHVGAGVQAWKALLAKVSDDPRSWARSVEKLFLEFDRDGSGGIDISELSAAVKSLGVSLAPEQLVAFRDEFSTSGQITLKEFVAAVEQRKPKTGSGAAPGSLEAAWIAILSKIDEDPAAWRRTISMLFRQFDKDESGEIDISELAAGLKSLGVSLAPDMLMAFRDEVKY